MIFRRRLGTGREITACSNALFGGSVLAAAIAVALAGMIGMRRLRKLVSGSSFRVVQLDASEYTDVAQPRGGSDYTNAVAAHDPS